MESFDDDNFESKLDMVRRAIHDAYGKLLKMDSKNEILDPVGPIRNIVTDFSYLDKLQEFEMKVDRKLDTELRCTYYHYIVSCFTVMTGKGFT